jgi:hypothetical protein
MCLLLSCLKQEESNLIIITLVFLMLTLSDPMSDLVRHYYFPVPDAFLDL